MNKKNLHIILVILLGIIFAPESMNAENLISLRHNTDSLKRELTKVIHDTVRYRLLNQLYLTIRFSDPLKALECEKEARALALKDKNTKRVAGATSGIGLIYSDLGRLELALENQLEALKLYESINDSLQVAGTELNVAMVYKKQGDSQKALEWLDKCLIGFKKAKSKLGEAYVYNNFAIIYRGQKKFDLAFDHYMKSLKIKEELHDTVSLGNGYLNMGEICGDRNEEDKGIEYCYKALAIFKRTNNIKGFAGAYNNLGALLLNENNYEEAIVSLKRAIVYAKQVHSLEDEQDAHKNLTSCLEKQGKYTDALNEYFLFRNCKDSILDQSGTKQMALLQAMYDTDKKDSELKGLRKDTEINEEKIAHDNLLITAAAGGMFLLIALVGLLFNRYRLREITNKKLAETNTLINYRKKEITDSISYARRIQESILPRFEKFNDIIPESFLIHKPRGIVSGDFYWIYRSNKIIYIAVADNLLHGVPGAFISMIGVNILNTAVESEHISDLKKMIQFMDMGIAEMISEHRDTTGQRRLDLSICKLDLTNDSLEFTGTDNPLFVVNKDGVQEIKSSLNMDTFDIQKVSLKKGDAIYMFTDGYVDQMGGGEGKKMLTRKVSEILFKNWPVPMHKQKEGILHEFETWRGNYDQVDDVLVMGIRV